MAYSYAVSYAMSATGPWTTFATVSALTDTVTGLTNGTTYWFSIIATDSTTGLSSAAEVVGPVTTAATGS